MNAKYLLYCIAISLLFISKVSAQLVYTDASVFPLLGKATKNTATLYERLPDSLINISRKPLWELGMNTAGLAIRFRSNSTTIAVKWETRFDNAMNHMTPTGIKGLDLYCLQHKDWLFVNSACPTDKNNSAIIISNMKIEEREYMLYLPLYDGINSLSIGIDSLSYISQPLVNNPTREKPIVFYGTSILQGGCASRPGMAHTNIISRRLNREIMNLGFSGNAFLDPEIASVMAHVNAGAFILDFVPNASVEQIEERAEQFYQILRDKQPQTPVLFIEDPIFTHTRFDQRVAEEVTKKNKALQAFYQFLKRKGERNIYFLSSKDILGQDGEATVDGIHFTDLGFMRYADILCPVIKKMIHY